jgi:hypothetical protein
VPALFGGLHGARHRDAGAPCSARVPRRLPSAGASSLTSLHRAPRRLDRTPTGAGTPAANAAHEVGRLNGLPSVNNGDCERERISLCSLSVPAPSAMAGKIGVSFCLRLDVGLFYTPSPQIHDPDCNALNCQSKLSFGMVIASV